MWDTRKVQCLSALPKAPLSRFQGGLGLPKSGGTPYHVSHMSFESLRTVISQGELKLLSIIESLDTGKETPSGFLASAITLLPDALSF